MQIEEIWDSSYRYRTIRFTGALPQSLHDNEVHQGESYVPERARISLIDEGSKGVWRPYVVNVEGYHSISTAPVYLTYNEPARSSGLGWLPAWLQVIVPDYVPRDHPDDEPETALVAQPPQGPGPMPEARPEPTAPNLFKVAEVRSLSTAPLQSVTWGQAAELAETQVLPPITASPSLPEFEG